MNDRKLGSTAHPVCFFMTNDTTHVAGATGLTPTVALSKDGAAFGAAAGAVAEVGNGWYALAGNATDRNTIGETILHATSAGADPTERLVVIVPWDPFADPDVALSGTLGSQGAGSVDAIVLPAGPAVNGVLAGSRLRITSGSAQYQERTIATWDGTGKIAGIDEPFTGGTPASGDAFEVHCDHSHQIESGNVLSSGQVSSLRAGALAQLFTLDSTKVRGDAVSGSVVGEINAQINTRLASSGYAAPNNAGIASILSLVGSMPVGMAGVVQDTGATTALVHTSGLPTSGAFPAAGAKLLIIWTSGPLAGRTVKGTYTAGAAGTQRLAFSPVLPTAPANGDTFAALEIPG